MLIDAVGIVESELADPQTLERKRSASLKQLLEAVGVTDEDTLTVRWRGDSSDWQKFGDGRTG